MALDSREALRLSTRYSVLSLSFSTSVLSLYVRTLSLSLWLCPSLSHHHPPPVCLSLGRPQRSARRLACSGCCPWLAGCMFYMQLPCGVAELPVRLTCEHARHEGQMLNLSIS